MKRARYKRPHTVMILFIQHFRKCKTILTWIRSVVTRGWDWLQRDMGTSGAVANVLYVDCSSSYIAICIFVKTYGTVHLRWMKCVLCKLSLKKPDFITSFGKPWVDSPTIKLEISECCLIGLVCFKSQNWKGS